MKVSTVRLGRRGAPAVLLLAAGLAQQALGADRSWNFPDGDWSTPNAWTPFGIPTAGDIVRIGNLAGMTDRQVTADQAFSTSALLLSNGARLYVETSPGTVGGVTHLGADSHLYIGDSVVGSDFVTGLLTLSGNNSQVRLLSGTVRVTESMAISNDTYVDGSGELRFSHGGTTLTNDGQILATNGSLHIIQENGGLTDLDGTTGNGHVLIQGEPLATASLVMWGSRLTDAFDGVMTFGSNARLYSSLDDGWELGAGGVINAVGGPGTDEWAWIGLGLGDDFICNGQINVGSAGSSALLIAHPTRVGVSAIVTLAHNSLLGFTNDTVIEGGFFDAPDTTGVNDGVVFMGATTWSGSTVFTGFTSMEGDGTVSANTGAVINAETFNFDGDGFTEWSLSAALVLNADAIDTSDTRGPNYFDGTVNLEAGVFSRLTINLTAPTEAWVMGGVMNVVGSSPFHATRLGGSPVVFDGELNITSGKVSFSADSAFTENAVVDLPTVSTELRLMNANRIDAGGVFTGSGQIQIGVSGSMTIEDGVNLDHVGLFNQGQLHVADTNGAFSVDRFANSSSGVIHFTLGGYDQGHDYDQIIITGSEGVTLDGTLAVSILSEGVSVFEPAVGDEFTIINSLHDITGQFVTVRATVTDDTVYHWDVIYGSNTVTIRVADAIPLPECRPDLNMDGELDYSDVLQFLNWFGAANDAADFNFDGLIDFADVLAFLSAFGGGCP